MKSQVYLMMIPAAASPMTSPLFRLHIPFFTSPDYCHLGLGSPAAGAAATLLCLRIIFFTSPDDLGHNNHPLGLYLCHTAASASFPYVCFLITFIA
ncbi:hypothetical protein AAFF_G00338060 [Aldrovandia affinis]|uniref:Uncharacterized protein n=1 Tax=Aldrovandia affinis TaxID=143900 RepID=A0AAD7SKY8_9TELE|nr:hypothetical protein AAFF_G00338060 [Aldrovandia affinis]